MQRQLLEAVAGERRLSWSYPYGVVEARLSSDELENMRVRFSRLRAVMPSGVVVDVPEGTELPPLDIKKAFESSTQPLTVSLGVPLYFPTRANALELGAEDIRVKRLYRVGEREVPDENTGENAQSVLLRRVNARLLLPGDDPSDLETMPLLRIVRSTGEDGGLPRQDARFISPCLVIAGSPVLMEMLRDIANQVEASRKELVVQMTRGGFNVDTLSGVRVQQMLRLRTLNHYAARLGPLMDAAGGMNGGGISPLAVYVELRTLLGELAALNPDVDAFEAPPYDHDDPAICFEDVIEKIRSVLKPEGLETWLKADFALDEGVLVAEMTEEHLSRPNEYFLAIKTSEEPRALAALVEDADEFKLMAWSMRAHRIRGVRLREERHPPLNLPSQVGLHYFRVLRSESARMWERIGSERKLAITFPGVESSSFESVSLYMTVPQGEG
jgi:type VI secretion system ImpJ/VasE family protein